MSHLAFFLSLPASAASGRMRVWRALKSLGAATLRDGVYLLPERPGHEQALREVAALAVEVGGSAETFQLSALDEGREADLRGLFDRRADYAAITEEARSLKGELGRLTEVVAAKRLQALVRRAEQVTRIDFHPGAPRQQVLDLLDDLRQSLARHYSPGEPTASRGAVPRLDRRRYRGRTWATRARPWVDRLASAWLIRRHVDAEARFVWLAKPADCRKSWLGFDFDGAAFSHVGSRVTFEVLAASFGLDDDAAIARLGAIVHCLDVGGVPVPEAAGVEAVLAGLRDALADDDQLLLAASQVFEGLYRNFTQDHTHG